jgi:hypothetical protein
VRDKVRRSFTYPPSAFTPGFCDPDAIPDDESDGATCELEATKPLALKPEPHHSFILCPTHIVNQAAGQPTNCTANQKQRTTPNSTKARASASRSFTNVVAGVAPDDPFHRMRAPSS